MPVALWELVLAAVITAGAAAVQSGVGVGFAMVSVPLLALIDGRLSPVPQLLLTVPLAFSMAWRERHAIELSGVWWVLAGRLPGAALGLVLLKTVDGRALDALIGLVVLGAVLVLASRTTIRRTRPAEFAAGMAAGTSGLVASIGGPPLALLYRNDRGEVVRSNLATIFTVGLLVSILVRAGADEIAATDVEVALWLLPALAVGYLAGGRLLAHFEGARLRRALLGLSGAAGAVLVMKSLAGW